MAATQPAVRLAYTLTLTREEYRALEWLEARGYTGDLILHATDRDNDDDTGGVTLKYREADAWAVQAAYEEDPHAFGACAGDALARKMYAFLDGII